MLFSCFSVSFIGLVWFGLEVTYSRYPREELQLQLQLRLRLRLDLKIFKHGH